MNDEEVSQRMDVGPVSQAKEEAEQSRKEDSDGEEVPHIDSLADRTPTRKIKFTSTCSKQDK